MKVSLKDDNMPNGTELHVRGLGMLVNGKTVEFSKEDVDRFEERTGMTVGEAFLNDDRIGVSGEQPKTKGGDA